MKYMKILHRLAEWEGFEPSVLYFISINLLI